MFINKLKLLRPLWSALSRRRRKQLLILQLLSVASAFGEVANIGALLPFLRLLANPLEGINALGPLAAPLRGFQSQQLLVVLGSAFMLVVVISTSLRLLTIFVQLRLSALISADLGEKVYALILHKSYPWHLRTNSSQILTYLTKDVDAVFASIQAVMLFIMNLLIICALGSYLVSLQPAIMISVALFISLFYALVYRFTISQLKSDGEVQVLEAQRSCQIIQESIGGIRDILLDNTQQFFLSAYRLSNLRLKLASASMNIKAQSPRYVIEGFVLLIIVGVSLSLAVLGQGIDKQLPLLGALALGAYRLLQPVQQCFGAVSLINSSSLSIARLRPYLLQDKVSLISTPEKSLQHDSLAGKPLIEFLNVSFRYESSSPWILRNTCLSIEKGDRIAFVGSTGSGKSTISDLILGLLNPGSGLIFVNGLNLHEKSCIRNWQSRVAHVPQQIYLSDSSFASNIAFGVPVSEINLARVRQAAQKACVAEMIESTPQGYNTLVGERGVLLSGGQRQRIGIARALYKDVELLVLDEATSALDNKTEAEVMSAINALDRTLTIILIAHRFSTIRNCDKIFMLKNGFIAAFGSYEYLIDSNTEFQSLANGA